MTISCSILSSLLLLLLGTKAEEDQHTFLRNSVLRNTAAGKWSQIGQGVAPGSVLSQYGISVATSADGNIFAAGAPTDRTSGNNSGMVCLNKLVGSDWEQMGPNIHGGLNDMLGFSIDLTNDGKMVAVGSPTNRKGGSNAGQARVFKLDGNEWKQMGSDINGRNGDFSGASVSLSGNGSILAVGSPDNNEHGASTGVVRIYEFDENKEDWIQKGKDLYGKTKGDQAGWSTSLSDDGLTVAWGAPFNRGRFPQSGMARVYTFDENSGDWENIGDDILGTHSNELSGFKIDLSDSGKIIAIGAPNNKGNGNKSGAVRVFKLSSENEWELLGNQISGERTNDEFGFDLSLSSTGLKLAVGSPFNLGSSNNSGMTKTLEYVQDTNSWQRYGNKINGKNRNDKSGMVALSGDGFTVAVGAPHVKKGGNDSGEVTVFKFDDEDDTAPLKSLK